MTTTYGSYETMSFGAPTVTPRTPVQEQTPSCYTSYELISLPPEPDSYGVIDRYDRYWHKVEWGWFHPDLPQKMTWYDVLGRFGPVWVVPKN